jgi:hypothetical protein
MSVKRTVTYDGKTYKVRKDNIEIPDLDSMERMAALVWLNQETYASGAGTRTRPNPLAGLGDAIRLEVR